MMTKKPVQIGKKLMAKKLGEEWVFLNLENGVYYGLNETGSRIWDELTKEKNPDVLAERLSLEFEIDRKIFEKDLKDFINDLHKEGLIEIESPAS